MRSKEWNPATFFIVIFLFIGSASINTIAVRNDNAAFVRRSDVRIGVLREVVEKLQRGEEVDVEQALGTGDPAREKEWEESKFLFLLGIRGQFLCERHFRLHYTF